MDISYLDYLANTRTGMIRNSSVVTKLFLCICCMAVSLSAGKVFVVGGICAFLILLNLLCGIRMGKLLHFMIYPLFFSLAFVFIRLFQDPFGALLILLKALSAVLSMVLLLITTPFPDLFAFLGLFLPKVLVSSIFFTYRIFFILLQQLSDALKSMRLRGRFRISKILFYLKSLANLLGSLFVRAIDMSERMSVIYAIRGFRGKVYARNRWYYFSWCDAVVLALGIAVACFGIFLGQGGVSLWMK